MKIGQKIIHEGHEFKIIGLGVVRDGEIFAHLASTTEGTQQANGFVARQINTFISTQELGS